MTEDRQFKEPDAAMRVWLAEALTALTMFEEHQSAEFCKALITRGPGSSYHSVHIGEVLSYLNSIGVITYREIVRNGHRLLLKRLAGDDKMRLLLLGNDPPVTPMGPVPEEPEPKPKRAKKKKPPKAVLKVPELPDDHPAGDASDKHDGAYRQQRKKRLKKKRKKKPKPAPESPPEPKPEPNKRAKKKRKCCDNKHVVRSRKTGKRWCKNCGKKYKTRKPKEE